MTVVSFVQLFGLLGLPGAAARYVAVYIGTGDPESLRGFLTRTTSVLLTLNLVLAGGMVLARQTAGRLYHAPDLPRYMPLFAMLMFFGAINVFYAQILAGFKDVVKRTVISNFIGTPVVLFFTVVLLATGMGLWGYMVAQIINAVVVAVLLVGIAWKLTPVRARWSAARLPPLAPEIISFSTATLGMNVLDFLVSQTDKILLGVYLNARSLGIYILASTLVAFVPIVLQSVNQIFAPIIADLHSREQKEVLGRLYRTLTKWVLGATLPLALVMIVFAPQLIRIFGPEFEPGWSVLVIGTLGQLVNCAVGSVGILLLMSGNQNRLFRVQFVSALLAVGLNLLLIPRLGIVGAALAGALVNAGSNLWNLREVHKTLGLLPYNRSYLALVLPISVALSVLEMLRAFTPSAWQGWPMVLLGLLMGYLFFGSVAVLALDQDDRLIVRSAWSQLRVGFRRLRVRT
jgi:O-antigen/teichoic acid export membrane protein